MADWLEVHRPGRADHVLSLIRQCRGGRLNDPDFGSRVVDSGAYAERLRQRFHAACRRLGLGDRIGGVSSLDTGRFRCLPMDSRRMTLF